MTGNIGQPGILLVWVSLSSREFNPLERTGTSELVCGHLGTEFDALLGTSHSILLILSF